MPSRMTVFLTMETLYSFPHRSRILGKYCDEVRRVLAGRLEPLSPTVDTNYEDVKLELARRYALSLPEAVEEPHFEYASFRVRGKIFATDNTCVHQGGPLGEGILEGEVISCPWHMWEYNVCTGEKVGNNSVKVTTYPVEIEGSDIKVGV